MSGQKLTGSYYVLVVPVTRLFDNAILPPTYLPRTVFSPAINQGDKALLVDCSELKGAPIPVISWMKDGASISSSSSQPAYQEAQQIRSNGMPSRRLVLQRFGAHEQGNYTCVATNRAGTDSNTFTITLQGMTAENCLFVTLINVFI